MSRKLMCAATLWRKHITTESYCRIWELLLLRMSCLSWTKKNR